MYSVGVMKLFVPVLMMLGCSDYQVVESSFVESFFQPDRGEGIDILWVVDNSATMYEEHDLLMDSADAFIGFVSNSSVDFRLGVISTDMEDDAGELNGAVLDVGSEDMVDSFIGRMISSISGLSSIMDAETVVVGMQPAVAITLVELGLTLQGVSTAHDAKRMAARRQKSALHKKSGDCCRHDNEHESRAHVAKA